MGIMCWIDGLNRLGETADGGEIPYSLEDVGLVKVKCRGDLVEGLQLAFWFKYVRRVLDNRYDLLEITPGQGVMRPASFAKTIFVTAFATSIQILGCILDCIVQVIVLWLHALFHIVCALFFEAQHVVYRVLEGCARIKAGFH